MTVIHRNDCPAEPLLEQLMLGQLAPTEADTLERHLQTCDDCRKLLDQLSDSEVLAEWRRGREQCLNAFPFLTAPLRDGDLGSIDHYAIEQVIGCGGSGIVFRATDQNLGRSVALKVLAFDLHYRATERFLRESRSAARMSGEHVVTVFGSGTTIDNRPYLVMLLVVGDSLRERLARELPCSRDSARLIRDAAIGLATIHAAGMIHRDIKPANILIDAATERAMLTDFGLARAATEETLTQANVVCGTPEYMSPEQADSPGTLTIESDIYSLGIALYESLTGATPFRGQPLQVLAHHQNTEPLRPTRLNPAIEFDLETICLKAISKSASDRYSSATAMAEDLQRFLTGCPILARPSSRSKRLRMWCGRNPALALSTAISLGLLLLLAAGSTLTALLLYQANQSLAEKQQRVVQAERRAFQDRTAAVDSLDALVDSLYDDLSKNAATIKTRKQVVNSVIAGLNSLTRIQGDMATDRTALKAYSRIADLYSLQGLSTEAEQAFESSIELARTLADKRPEDPEAQRELATAMDQYALHAARIHNFETLLKLKTETNSILSQLLTKNPDDLAALRQLVTAHSRDLDYLWQKSTPEKALELTRSAVADANRLLELEPGSGDNYRIANNLHCRLGRAWLESGNLRQAEEEFDLAKQHIDRAIQLSGDNSIIRTQSAVTDRMRGVLLNSLGKQTESLESFRRSLECFLVLSNTDPDDSSLKQNVANTLLLTVPSHLAINNIADAMNANGQAIDIYNQLLNSSDQKVLIRSLLVQAHSSLVGLNERTRQWVGALENAKAVVKLIEGDTENPPLDAPHFELAHSSAKIAARSAAHMIDESSTVEKPEEIVATLILIASIEASDQLTDAISAETRDRMKRIAPEIEVNTLDDLIKHINTIAKHLPMCQLTADFHAGRLWGLRARALADADKLNIAVSTIENERQIAACSARAVACLKTFNQDFPGYLGEIYKEPDFIWLRDTVEFHSSGLVVADP